MKITGRYMKVPVSRYSERKEFLFFDNDDNIIADYKIQLCTHKPEYYFYIDMRLYKGLETNLRIKPDVDFLPEFTDIIPEDSELYKEKFRPGAHFTAAMGWINDPNGLIYMNGLYHMFYQHNPAGPMWSNMHWGHAVSRDLLHWEEKEIALFPDKLGTAYSGSAIEDVKNISGLKENDNNPMLLFYTACNAGMKMSENSPTSQCLAYSTDGGISFKKYKNNPIIPNIINDNRDPKVIYCDEENCYYMALYIDKKQYALLYSENLTEWNEVQRFNVGDDNECPDFYPLYSNDGEKYWIFSGAHDKYLVGKINDKKFEPVQAVQALHYGNKAYAAQTFSGLPNSRKVRISWNRSKIPESYFNSSMCTPSDMTLIKDNDRLYLCINPIKELIDIEKDCSPEKLTGKAQDINISIKFTEDTLIDFKICGFNFTVNTAEHNLIAQDMEMPLFDNNDMVKIRIINDTTSVEIYSGSGKAFGVYEHIADYDLNFIKYNCLKGSADITIDAKEIKNIWE